MATRGRESAASKAVAALAAVEIVDRPDAPYDLTDEQAEEWRSVVGMLPADWFPRETHALLASYCRHVVAARKIAMLIAAEERKRRLNVFNYDALLRMQERESRAISSLMTRMRITQQALYDKSKKKAANGTVKAPWET